MRSLIAKELVNADAEIRLEKKFFSGTHRASKPEHLLNSLVAEFPRFGISRVARITGLDRIGIEVFTASRPNSRGLSVTQGKGVGETAAKLSGVMEAIEYWHGERPECPLILATPSELVERQPDAPTHLWSHATSHSKPILWTMATNLVTGRDVPVPFDLVHASFRHGGRPYESGLIVTTNGLASGGNVPEALTHALCEVIERHATAEFGALPAAQRADHTLDLRSVSDPVCQSLIGLCAGAQVGLKVWETTCDVLVPSYVACIDDERDSQTPPGFGAGCHPARDIALSRAITEAAQSRLTRISGARDDLAPRFYDALERTRAKFLVARGDGEDTRRFAEAPDCASDCLVEDLRRVVARLESAGHPEVFAVTLSDDPRYGVVRVIVPTLTGLEAKA